MAYETINISTANDGLGDTAREGAQKINDNFAQSYGKFNILGTVSQTSGVPTGAIIERGSNSNGEYVKFADGTLICSYSESLGTYTDNKATLNMGTFLMPVSFIATPTFANAAVTVSSASAAYVTSLKADVGSLSVTSWSNVCRYAVTTQSDSVVGVSLRLIAIGRWY